MEKTIRYTKDKVTVLWQPGKCIHSGNCVAGLPKVFRPKEKPWVDMEGAEINAIITQVAKCPSGALSIHREE